MRNRAAGYIHLGLKGLSRRPVLTAVLVYLAGFGAAALVAATGHYLAVFP